MQLLRQRSMVHHGQHCLSIPLEIWICRTKITLRKKLQLYNATSVPIMLYSCSSWAATKLTMDKLDACHRKHQRTVTGHQRAKSVISNHSLNKMCNTILLSVKVAESRWSMFGHALRMPTDTPAQKALEFAIIVSSKYKACKG